MPGRSEVLDDMIAAIRTGQRPLQNGRWGKANVEVTLAIAAIRSRAPRSYAGASGGGILTGDWTTAARFSI